MNPLEHLRQLIDQEEYRLRSGVPPERAEAVIALIGAIERLPGLAESDRRSGPYPDMIAGRPMTNPGGNKALQLLLESRDADAVVPTIHDSAALADWADSFLSRCAHLAAASLVLAHLETGFMRILDAGNGTFPAWIATKRAPTSWREHADFDWWGSWLATRHEPQLQALQAALSPLSIGDPGRESLCRQIADVVVDSMSYQLGYPPEAEIDGCTIQTYCDVLRILIGRALCAQGDGEPIVIPSRERLISAIAAELALDPVLIGHALDAFTLNRENARYHAAVPGIASAPLIRIDTDHLVWSIHGLTTEPLLFLARELRRRAAQEYHNRAHLREDLFRQDLYALFSDKRFVTSTARIQLRRNDGNLRTDVDAVVFDRKTGTLGVFELKSQDPFARSAVELTRQRDNILFANRQVSGVLDWLKRHGADELLERVDRPTAKKFRVQKVYPFVLGRYLAHFSDGSEPDHRAAWGTWPQLLRLLDTQPFQPKDANPIASLFNWLSKDVPLSREPVDGPPQEILLGTSRLVVYPSYAAMQTTRP